ncbi:Fras1 [Symbiodinium necroappetens]|uniref:Fras1 protein n=1 Tax=Symbiodinium necroappetens TaxID=1628268 RepID=A0A813B8T1_9DINO|nr:Fras1 [Symbiodinium necroappetens]
MTWDGHLKLSYSTSGRGILFCFSAVEVKPLSSLLKRPAWLGVFEASTENGCEHVLKFELKKTTMLKVCEYLKHHRDHSVSEVITPLPSSDLRDCGVSRWDCSFVNIDVEALFDIGFAATTLGIPSLDFLVNAKLACMTNNKSADKLRREYKMINDLPAQEEAELRRTYTALQKQHGEDVDVDLSQLAAASVFHNGMAAARTQLESIKNGEDETQASQTQLNPKSWRYGMWSAGVKKDWQLLADAPYEITNDRELVQNAIVSSQGRALKYASVELRADENLVLLATSFFGTAFADAAPELWANRRFVLAAVGSHGAALAHASDALQSDKSFLVAAAKAGSGSCLQGAKESLKSDRDLVLEMVVHDGASVRFVTEELRNDKAFAIEAVKRNGAALKFLLPKFQADVEIVQAAVARDPRAASHAHASRRRDLGLEGESALGETHLAKEYAAQAEAGQAKAQKDEVVSVAGIGHRQMPWQEALGQLNYTTMKLGKQVGFSAGSTMMGNLGQGNYVAANSVNDIFPALNRPEIDSSTIMWGGVGGGIGMRWASFGSNDVLHLLKAREQWNPIRTMPPRRGGIAVRFVCARMHPPPLVMPSKFDRETRANILTPTAGMIKLDRDHDRLHMVFSIYARQVLLATCLQELPQAESEGAKAAEDWEGLAATRDREALKNLQTVDRRLCPRPLPLNMANSPLGGWPDLLNDSHDLKAKGKMKSLLQTGTQIVLTGVHGKNGMTGSLSQKFSDGKWKVQIDGVGSAILHEDSFEISDSLAGQRSMVDQVVKDERTALRRAKILEKRSQLLEKKAAKNQAMEKMVALTGSETEMIWSPDEACFSYSMHVGESGGMVVQGPDPKWRLLLDEKGFAKKVHWLPELFAAAGISESIAAVDMWATSAVMAESQIAAGESGTRSLPAAPPIRAVSVREWLKSQRQAPGYGPISTSMDTAEESLLPDAENHKEPRTWMRAKSLEQGASSDQETLLSRLPGRSESASTPWWLPTHSPSGSPHKDSSLLSVERYNSSQNGRHSSSLPRSLRPWVPGAMPDPARRPLSQSSEERSPATATAGQELDSSKREVEMDAGAVAAIEAPSPWSRPDKAIWGRCDSITDDRMLRPASSPVVDSVTEVIELEHDFYSISLTPQVPCWAAICAPLASCIAQLLVLYFLAYQNETMFEGGKWKQPISSYWSLNTMKMISIMLSLFKVSIELGHAQRLCRCLVVGAFAEGFRPVVGWWALALQYFMALLVLFVSLSVVLGSTSCVGCFLKIFSVFIIVDMDNLAAGFVDGMTYLDFRVEVSPERLQAFKRRHGGICRCLSIRAIFMFMPVTLILLSLAMSIYFNTIPLTLLSFGKVSNEDPPKMLVDDGTCVAQLVHHKGQGLSANVSVLLLAALDADSDKALAPRLHWVALEYAAQPVTPSSLQVMRGNDANNNGVFKSQAYHWLEARGFSPHVYSNLLKREKLYKTFQPFEATFLIPGIQEDAPASYTPSTYMVYVTAQNPLSNALAAKPAMASLLIPACAHFCTSCELAGPRLCDEGKCIEGTHFHLGKCYPCAKDCDKCELNALGHNMSDSESIGCDNGGCKEGFGLKHGRCQPCKDANCSRCLDEDLDVCVECKHGLSINFNGSCQTCGGPHCRRCLENGGCDSCEHGWGPAENATCAECVDGCRECPFSHTECTACQLGYVLQHWKCHPCLQNCRNCSSSGLHGCDDCIAGFGLDKITMECTACQVENCLGCDGEPWRCSRCRKGFGVTSSGLCQDCGEFCAECVSIDDCKVCHTGWVARDGRCLGCADRCSSCNKAGPAKCDRCFQGFQLNSEETCERRVSF